MLTFHGSWNGGKTLHLESEKYDQVLALSSWKFDQVLPPIPSTLETLFQLSCIIYKIKGWRQSFQVCNYYYFIILCYPGV